MGRVAPVHFPLQDCGTGIMLPCNGLGSVEGLPADPGPPSVLIDGLPVSLLGVQCAFVSASSFGVTLWARAAWQAAGETLGTIDAAIQARAVASRHWPRRHK